MGRKPTRRKVPLQDVIPPGDLKPSSDLDPASLREMAQAIGFQTRLQNMVSEPLRALLGAVTDLQDKVRQALRVFGDNAPPMRGLPPPDDVTTLGAALPSFAVLVDAAAKQLVGESEGLQYANPRPLSGLVMQRALKSASGMTDEEIANAEIDDDERSGARRRRSGTTSRETLARKKRAAVKKSLTRMRTPR
jgi:hypothetical protein